jgi:hypothetical protein
VVRLRRASGIQPILRGGPATGINGKGAERHGGKERSFRMTDHRPSGMMRVRSLCRGISRKCNGRVSNRYRLRSKACSLS